MKLEHIQGETLHARRGGIKNVFRYGVDFVLVDPVTDQSPALFSRNRFNLWSVHDRHHGGARGNGQGVAWFREVLTARGIDLTGARLLLLTQPGFIGIQFNPVSFWIALRSDAPFAIVAEVNNTFGDRHCYFCAKPDLSAIEPRDSIVAEKLMHVSPFQEVKGRYTFNFNIGADGIEIRISYENGAEGVFADLRGSRRVATNRSLLWAALRRPMGAARVVGLIHWQALKLWLRKAPFRKRPAPPAHPVTDSQTVASGAQPDTHPCARTRQRAT